MGALVYGEFSKESTETVIHKTYTALYHFKKSLITSKLPRSLDCFFFFSASQPYAAPRSIHKNQKEKKRNVREGEGRLK